MNRDGIIYPVRKEELHDTDEVLRSSAAVTKDSRDETYLLFYVVDEQSFQLIQLELLT